MNEKFPLITVLGPTAAGKTAFAANLAIPLDAEVISADSRQVFKYMDIGTGKDLSEYNIGNRHISTHLIDIAEPGTEYNVYRFQRDFQAAWASITAKGKTPLLCGGTGMYLESVLLGYNFSNVPVNEVFRNELLLLTDSELVQRLSGYRKLHNTTDTLDRDRMIRALEIEWYKKNAGEVLPENKFRQTPVLGITFSRENLRKRITGRLKQRLNEGMTEEVQHLMNRGVSLERVKMYGLEYKYNSMFLAGELKFDEMFGLLNTAIHQFAKRQMTWYRRMENKGIKIHWLEGEDGLEKNLVKAKKYLNLPV